VDADAIRDALGRMRKPGPPRLEVLDGAALAGAEQAGGGRPDTVGLIPGSFDPMTVAHAALADALRTDLTLFVYSVATLPKEAGTGGEVSSPLLAPEDRVASLLAYCDSRPQLGVALSSHGLYVDQAAAAAEAFPGVPIVLGMGSDKVVQLFDPRWYEDRDEALRRLFSRARVAYAIRPGHEERLRRTLAASPWRTELQRVDLPVSAAAVSSTSVREALRREVDVAGQVPDEIRRFL
jgi:nicotinamide-nucleotide adenylyltransferase